MGAHPRPARSLILLVWGITGADSTIGLWYYVFMILKRRSWFGRLLKFPSVLLADYKIIRPHNSFSVSLRTAFELALGLLLRYPY